MHKVLLSGFVGQTPEVKHIPRSNETLTVTSFSVATREYMGKGKEHVEWHDCYAYGQLGEHIASNFDRGSPIELEGRIRTQKYTKNDGSTASKTRIQVVEVSFVPRARKTDTSNGDQGNSSDFERADGSFERAEVPE